MSGPLSGTTIVEFADYVTGPYAAVLLADMGARVIKIEAPGQGDPFRGWGAGGYSPTFCSVNRGKESITLDLRRPEGQEGARALARRARGTPRVANRLLKRARDFAEVRGQGSITDEIAADALQMLDIDHLGLDDIDRRILRAIVEKFGGGPVGIDTLAAAISEETDTLMDVYEPYLIQLGFLQRTPRGRMATEGAYAHLGIPIPASFNRQPALFGGMKG